MLLRMRPLWPTKADGTPRYRARLSAAPDQRSRVTNGKRPFDRRSSEARRLEDLTAAYLAEFEAPGEAAISIARAAALASLRIERIEAAEMAGRPIDDERLVRLIGALNRSIQALASLRPKPAEVDRGVASLAEHLAAIVERRRQAGADSGAESGTAPKP
jgi:hypothetical protein